MGRDQWWSISSNMRSMRPRRSLCWPHPTVQAASNYWETFSLDFLTIVQIQLLKHHQWLNQRFRFCGRHLLPEADVLYSRLQLLKISKLYSQYPQNLFLILKFGKIRKMKNSSLLLSRYPKLPFWITSKNSNHDRMIHQRRKCFFFLFCKNNIFFFFDLVVLVGQCNSIAFLTTKSVSTDKWFLN